MHQETAGNRLRPSRVNSARPPQAPCRPSRVKSCPSRVKRSEVVHRPSTSIAVSGEAAAHHRHLWRCSRTWPASPVLTMPDPQWLPPADQAGEGMACAPCQLGDKPSGKRGCPKGCPLLSVERRWKPRSAAERGETSRQRRRRLDAQHDIAGFRARENSPAAPHQSKKTGAEAPA